MASGAAKAAAAGVLVLALAGLGLYLASAKPPPSQQRTTLDLTYTGAAAQGIAAEGLAFSAPPGCTIESVTIDFSVSLVGDNGVALSGQTVVVSIPVVNCESRSTKEVVLTTDSNGTASGSATVSYITGTTSLTMSAAYAGGTVNGTYYEASSKDTVVSL